MTSEECNHYWIIETANGPSSMGECKYCHKRREFLNWFPEGRTNPFNRAVMPKEDEDDEQVKVQEVS